jgi:carboxyl-terminal processing protease
MQNINNTRAPKYLLIFLGVVAVYLGGFYTGKVDLFAPASSRLKEYEIRGDKLSDRNGVDVNLLWEVWSELENEYLDPEEIDGQQLLYGAVDGLVKGLDDQYTSFLTPDETKDYLSSNKREFQGIGTTLAEEGDFVIIESPIDDSPAQKAGLKAKDVILKVDGNDMKGKSVVEVAKNIRGDANSKVTITFYRASENLTKDIEIIRKVIDLESLEIEDLGDGIMRLKVYQFTDASVEAFNREWDSKINEIVRQNPKGLVIDLRNNPGGFVDAVRHATGEFLPKGTLVFQEENKSGNRLEYKVNRDGKLKDVPVVVLVNEGSASASEIFAGAIQDNDRGVIVGAKTVGKGVEQKLVNLSDGSMLQIVFQKWLTPKGRQISKDEPITPDVLLTETEAQEPKAIEILKGN